MNSIIDTRCGDQGNTGEPARFFGKNIYMHNSGNMFRKMEEYGISGNTFLAEIQTAGK